MRAIIFTKKTFQNLGSALAGLTMSLNADGQVLHESVKLLASDRGAGNEFGIAVSVSGEVALAGAWADDDYGANSGSAYVFRWDGSSWVEEQKLLPTDGAAGKFFGSSASVSGDVAVVGAYEDDTNGSESGSAYVFRWDGSSWVEEQKLLPSDGAAGDRFGVSVSGSGNAVVVGAYRDGDQGLDSGSAYVFRWNGSSWVQEQKLLPSDGAAGDGFGFSTSISGDAAVVGAKEDDDHGPNSGSAYVFRWNGSSWIEEQKLLASDGAAEDRFGVSVSVAGDAAVVGAVWHDDNGMNSGSAYVFRWDGSTWMQEQKLLASDGAAEDALGRSVSVSGNLAVVSAINDDDGAIDAGSAYVFRWSGSTWVQDHKLLASDGALKDTFGWSVGISGDVAVVGAFADIDTGIDSGSAYVFDLTAPPIPTVSQWGLVALTLMLLTAGTIALRRPIAMT